MRRKLITALMSGVLLGLAVLAVPQPAHAVAGETFYISADETPAASVGAGTSCTDADVEYDPATGLESALAAIYEDPDFDSGDEIVLCDVDAADGEVDYVMLGDVEFDDGNFDDDNDGETANAVTLDLSDAAAPGSVTIRGDADDSGSIIIDANDGVGDDDGGYSPFDFTDANVTIEFLTILNAWDDSDGGAIHLLEDDSTNGLTLTLNSVTIEYAYAQGGDGAGAYVQGDVVISDSVFEDNATGGEPDGSGAAVYAEGDVTISGSEFTDNAASVDGGAVYAEGDVTISGSEFTDNGADDDGGAVYPEGDVTISGSEFTDNAAGDHGGAVYPEGDVTISGSEFTDNGADDHGGAVYVDSVLQVSVTDTIFDGNTSGNSGGAIYARSIESLTIESNQFQRNTAANQGGAIRVHWGTSGTSITRNTFTGNSAEQGGAVSINDHLDDSYLWSITRNTFTNNRATLNGGALHMALDDSGNVVTPNVNKNRFNRNSAPRAGAVVVESDYGTERVILRRYERGLRRNSFQANRATSERRSANIGVHFD